jgi:ribosomal-protein-alanine N-acetyltransferase
VWVVEQAYTLVGALAFRREPFAFHIVQIAVDPRYRHRGFGRHLIQTLIREAQRQGIPTLVAEVRMENHAAIAFYKKLGFHVFSHALRYPDGSPGAVVRLEVYP